MSQRPASLPESGKINLEQQRKRAKALLKQLKQGVDDSTAAAHLSRPVLSDAQWLIARELGFRSWPKLKAHVDAINFAMDHPDFIADDEVHTTHWRCGNDIAHSLKLAGFKGGFQMLSDPLCMGPLSDVPFEQYKEMRSRFISETFGIEHREAAQRLEKEYARLSQLADGSHNVLWCEADGYDQLFLIRALAGVEKVPDRLELIQVDRIPGVKRFIGLGQLAPDLLAWLWPQRKRVNAAMLSVARRAWRACCASTPQELAKLSHQPHESLPLLAPALRRQLQELPGIEDGLSLTERLTLQVVNERGPMTYREAFAEVVHQRDPLPYLGDLMFYALLQPLIHASQPLLIETERHRARPERVLSLTASGNKALRGETYWFHHASLTRWVGGISLQPGEPHWTIDNEIYPVWRR